MMPPVVARISEGDRIIVSGIVCIASKITREYIMADFEGKPFADTVVGMPVIIGQALFTVTRRHGNRLRLEVKSPYRILRVEQTPNLADGTHRTAIVT
jgi:hypothetical protein